MAATNRIPFPLKSQRASRRGSAAARTVSEQQQPAGELAGHRDTEDTKLTAAASEERNGDAYDELTVEVEKAEVLVAYIAERLTLLSQDRGSELFALSLIARQICDEQFERISDKCNALH